MKVPHPVPRRRLLLALLAVGLVPVGCGDPGEGAVTTDPVKEGGPSRLKRLEQLKDEAASKKSKKGGR